jgi:hypothetical protein
MSNIIPKVENVNKQKLVGDKRIRITESQLKEIEKYLLNEDINLNLTKQIRTKQLNLDINYELDNIFGKNVYRLYYDLNTGKQITPTKTIPKLKFDVNIIDGLKNDVENILKNQNFSLVDFEKNIAKNNKNGQNIKITKAIGDYDYNTTKEYNEYLGDLTKKYNGDDKLYVVLSRHSHDIAAMASKPNITSCEDVREYTDIKQTAIGREEIGEGNGAEIWSSIKNGLIVFYLIRENDWNIKDPISRVIGTTKCEFGNSNHFYGKFSNKFKNFVSEWMSYYSHNIEGKYNYRTDKEIISKDKNEIRKILTTISDSSTEYDNLIRLLIKNKRYDVIYDLMLEPDGGEIVDGRIKPLYVVSKKKTTEIIEYLYGLFGYKVFRELPENIKDPIFNEINLILNQNLHKLKNIYDIIYLSIDKTEFANFITQKPEYKSYFNIHTLTIDAWRTLKHPIPYGNLSKLVNVELYNDINQYINKINKVDDVTGKIETYYNKILK